MFKTENMSVDNRPPPIQPIYANEYTGEWVNYQLGTEIERKHITPKHDFYKPGGKAIVLGNGTSRERYPLDKLNNSSKYKRLKDYNIIYGCNGAYVEPGELDWLVVTHRFMLKSIPRDRHNVVYTTPENQRQHKATNLIPLYHRMDAGATAAMLAAFHGASQVFLFGFDGQNSKTWNNNLHAGSEYYASSKTEVNDRDWHVNLYKVIAGYKDVMFYRVDILPPAARMLTVLPNHKLISFNEFASFADL